MAKINMTAIKVAVAKDQSGRMKRAAEERAQEVFEDAVIGMQIDFEAHPVTEEIAGGIESTNISETLGGDKYAPKSLFSFIGFEQGSKPLEPIRDALNPDSPIGKLVGPKYRYIGKEVKDGNARFKFEFSAPDKQAIYKTTPMPWASGWSWAQKIETKIPGFAYFLAQFMPDADDAKSRSKGGTQLKTPVRTGEYTPPEGGYLTGIFDRFLDQIRTYRKGYKQRFKTRTGVPK